MEKTEVLESMKRKIKYPKDMDKECVAICDCLNELPHTETEESCCGHLSSPFRICFKCSSFTCLAIIARAVDRRYAGTKKVWRVVAETADINPRFNFLLTSVSPYDTQEEMIADTEQIISNIRYWRDNFLDYFRSNGEVTNPGKKDHTPTWEDAMRLVNIADELASEWGKEKMADEGPKAYYTEILKRYEQCHTHEKKNSPSDER